MNIINDYVDQMFKTVPITKETQQLKTDILANMEDKYLALKEEGVSEHEAIGIVIAEFGNIEELLEEMGFSKESRVDESIHYHVAETEELEGYIEAKRKSGLNIGLGVLSILIGIAGLLITMAWSNFARASIYIGLIVLLAFAVIGIGLFIIEGMKLQELNGYHSPFVLLPSDRDWLEEVKQNYKRSFTFSIVVGVSLCLLSLTPLFLSLLISQTYSVLTGVALMLVLAGLGIVLFIYSGNYWNAFTVLLTNGKSMDAIEGEVKREIQKKKANHFIDEIYWPILIALYFILSFWQGGWGWTWLIFVLGGVLEEAILAIFTPKEQ